MNGQENLVNEPAAAGREYWRAVLAAGGHTAIPRWTLDPVPGVAGYETTVPADLVAALTGPGGEPPLGTLLLAAHAKVLAALSREGDVVTGLVAGGRPLPLRLLAGAARRGPPGRVGPACARGLPGRGAAPRARRHRAVVRDHGRPVRLGR
jgi:hypothetical protein